MSPGRLPIWTSRLCRAVGALLLMAAWLIMGAAIIALIATDRWSWSQYLFWVPEEAWVSSAAILVLLGAGVQRLGGPARRRRRLPRVSAIAASLLGVHLALVHWNSLRACLRPPRGAAPSALRVLNWNITGIEKDTQITGTLGPLQPDLAILSNSNLRQNWDAVLQSFGSPRIVFPESIFIVFSRFPVIRRGSITLGIDAPRRRWPDPGHAMFIELDTTERLGRTTVVWVIDLPSDWRLSRWAMAQQAAAAIAAWSDAPRGNSSGEPNGFPAPDLVIGDFNAPRGSASLALLAPGMANAFDQGGAGWAASWPGNGYKVPFPVFHLDQMFVARNLRAVRYEIIKPAYGYHWPQYAEMVAR